MTDHSGKSMFVSSPIDVDTWNSAGERRRLPPRPSGRAPPAVGLIFKNEAARRKIFTDWRSRSARRTPPITSAWPSSRATCPGRPAGYYVHIGAEPEVVQQRTAAAGMKDPQKLLIMLTGACPR